MPIFGPVRPCFTKPCELDKDEVRTTRKHPEYGLEALALAIGVAEDVREMWFITTNTSMDPDIRTI